MNAKLVLPLDFETIVFRAFEILSEKRTGVSLKQQTFHTLKQSSYKRNSHGNVV